MTEHEKIAVIGVALRFPGARDVEGFWRAVLSGQSSIATFDKDPGNPDYVPVHGVLEDHETFDAELFGYSPREAQLTDPQQRKFLECAFEALERAGHPTEPDGRAYGVVAGAGNNSYFVNNVLPDAALSADWGETAGFIASEKDHLATRVAHRLDLTGPALSVQTSCSTSLVAVHLACRALQAGDADLMLAGGSTIQVPHEQGHLYTPHGVASRDGFCRPFDARASGTVFGSGVGVVVLKRLSDALADGDPVLGVIAGSAINNDGSRKVGYTAPSVPGQVEVIRKALSEAGVEPAEVGYVETHGTGTELGDAIEFEALREALGSEGGDAPCVLGTLKPQVGHLDSAAGVAGLIKAMMVVATGTVPANIGSDRPHPQLDMTATRFELRAANGEWPAGHAARWAGVSSYGLGGTNAHVVLEQPPTAVEPTNNVVANTPVVLPVSGQTAEATQRMLDALPDAVRRLGESPASLAGAARTLQQHRRQFPYRAAVVGSSLAGAGARARLAKPRRTVRNPRLGFLFTGFGGQWPEMCEGLANDHPVFATALSAALDALRQSGVELPLDITAVAPSQWRDATTGQPLLFAVQYAVAKLVEDVAGAPDLVLGHSLGEYAAACIAGGLELRGAADLVAARAEIIAAAAGGGMTSVLASEQQISELLGTGLVVAARNTPGSVVVSGGLGDLNDFERLADAAGITTRRLDIDTAGHSPHLDGGLPAFRERANRVTPRPLTRRLVSTLTGRSHEPGEVLDAAYWTDHMRHTVNFESAIREVGNLRSVVLVEIGAGQALSGLVQQIPTRRELLTVPTLPGAREDLDPRAAFAGTVADLWTLGIAVDWERGGGPGPQTCPAPMPTYPFATTRHWIEPASTGAVVREVGAASEAIPATPQPEPSASSAPEADEVAAAVARLWAGLLGTEVPADDVNFFAAGGDSLLLVRLIGQLREAFGVAVPLREAAADASVRGIADLLSNLRSNQ